jgi:multidrug resistance efflux pump
METLMLLTYAAICVAVFKIFKIPLNKWTVPTAVLGGVGLVGSVLIVMNYNHPFSESVRQYYATTPIISEIRGRVIDVPVKPYEPLKKGDLLFQIDPEPYQHRVEGLEGEIVAARKDLERAEQLFKTGAVAERTLDQNRAAVEELQASLDEARFELEQTTVTAPADGFVAHLALRPGMMAVPMPFAPLMTFVPTEDKDVFFGWFRQNYLLRVEAGSEAEVTLDGIPGVIFKGEVVEALPVLGEGQVPPSGTLIRFDPAGQTGRIPVAIRITDPRFEQYELPAGLFGQAAIYTHHFHHVGTIRKILLRMVAWMNYVFPLH